MKFRVLDQLLVRYAQDTSWSFRVTLRSKERGNSLNEAIAIIPSMKPVPGLNIYDPRPTLKQYGVKQHKNIST